jgi:hypothetical protein
MAVRDPKRVRGLRFDLGGADGMLRDGGPRVGRRGAGACTQSRNSDNLLAGASYGKLSALRRPRRGSEFAGTD